MQKICLYSILILLCACSSHDPILSGKRNAVFDNENTMMMVKNAVPDVSAGEYIGHTTDCPYIQNSNNTINNGDKIIYTGFAMKHFIDNKQQPICYGKYIFAGFTTGEVIKIDSTNYDVVWTADVFANNNFTGTSPIVDIVAPMVIKKDYIYAAGMGNAMCKINIHSGIKKWCINVSSITPFSIIGDTIFIVDINNMLYAIRDNDGAVFYTKNVKQQEKPIFDNGQIKIGQQILDAKTGNIL